MSKSLTLLILLLLLPACTAPATPSAESQIVESAWQDFIPFTSSRNRANWDVKEVRQVKGSDVAKRYGDRNPFACIGGKRDGKPPDNEPVDANETYWQAILSPKPATAIPRTRLSPTEPPAIPEPHLRDAYYLFHPRDLRIVARAFTCVIY